jgi:hypothetical protein
VQITLLLVGNRERVTPCATILESHRIGAPRSIAAAAARTAPGEKNSSLAISTMPQA